MNTDAVATDVFDITNNTECSFFLTCTSNFSGDCITLIDNGSENGLSEMKVIHQNENLQLDLKTQIDYNVTIMRQKKFNESVNIKFTYRRGEVF